MKFIIYFLFIILYLPVYSQIAINNQLPAWKENKGQLNHLDPKVSTEVLYYCTIGSQTIYITDRGMSFQIVKTDSTHLDSTPTYQSYRMAMEWLGTKPIVFDSIEKYGESEDYENYYSTKEIKNVRSYRKLLIKNLYHNIDWVLYTTPKGEIKHDLIVHPGGNPHQIQWHYKATEEILLEKNGNLIIRCRLGDWVEKAPIAFQSSKETYIVYHSSNDTFSYTIKNYNPTQTLFIDPQIVWSTYYGGEGIDDISYNTNIKINESIYFSGGTNSFSSIAHLGFQNTNIVGFPAFIAKFNIRGNRIWGTYYQGSGQQYMDDFGMIKNVGCIPISMTTNSINDIFITISSNDISGLAHNGYQMNKNPGPNGENGSNDVVLAKFDTLGNRIWAFYYGGNGDDDFRVHVLSNNNLLLYGRSTSTNLLYNRFQNTMGDPNLNQYVCYMMVLSPAGTPIWGSSLGVQNNISNILSATTIDTHFVVLLQTNSSDPLYTFNNPTTTNSGLLDLVVAKISNNGFPAWGRFLGGNLHDFSRYITYNSITNRIIAVGNTRSTSGIALNGFKSSLTGLQDGFLIELDTQGNKLWGTYIGGNLNDQLHSCFYDRKKYLYAIGNTNSTDIAYNSNQTNIIGGNDAIIVKLSPNKELIYSNIVGGDFATFGTPNYDHFYYGQADQKLNIYLTGNSKSLVGISTTNAYQISNGGQNDIWLLKLSCPPKFKTIFDTICNEDSLYFNQKYLKLSGTYLDTLDNWEGCDSFLTLHIVVRNLDTTTVFDTVCSGSSYNFHGNILATSGTYFHTLNNRFGCDSTIKLHLSIGNAFSKTFFDTIRTPQPLFFGGKNRYLAGIYRDTLKTSLGCDSILILQLAINFKDSSHFNFSICQGDSIFFEGNSYKNAGFYAFQFTNQFGVDSIRTYQIQSSIAPILSFVATPSYCNLPNGTISVNIQGGTPPYTYLWNDSNTVSNRISFISKRTYGLKITDTFGCSDTSSIFLDSIPKFTTIITIDTPYCGLSNGQIKIQTTGAIGQVNYRWNGQVGSATKNNLDSGNMSLIVSDQYCADTIAYQITYKNKALRALKETTEDKICYSIQSGRIEIVLEGGLPPYTYQWSNGANTATIANLMEGTYGLVARDQQGCVYSNTYKIATPNKIEIQDTLYHVSCYGKSDGKIKLGIVNGIEPYRYLWSNNEKTRNISNLSSGTYKVTIENNIVCLDSFAFVIKTPAPIQFRQIQLNPPTCNNGWDGSIVAEAVGGVSIMSYKLNDKPVLKKQNWMNLNANTYKITAYDSSGCSLDTIVKLINPLKTELRILPKDTSIVMGSVVQMHYNSSIPLLRKEWMPEMYFNCSTCDSPILATYKDVEITLKATDKNQCEIHAATHVYIWDSSALFIPDAFTPDKSTNETFRVYGRSIKAAQIQIYNRWGEKVFESDKALEEGWDGQFKSEPAPSGTYIYSVSCTALNKKIYKQNGHFILIR